MSPTPPAAAATTAAGAAAMPAPPCRRSRRHAADAPAMPPPPPPCRPRRHAPAAKPPCGLLEPPSSTPMSPTPPAGAAAMPAPPCRRSRRHAADAPAMPPPPPPCRPRRHAPAAKPSCGLLEPPSSTPYLLTPEVWDVIAGAADGDLAFQDSVGDPAVRIPAVGSNITYHPYFHVSPASRRPDVPRNHRCWVHDVELLVDSITHGLYADITLGDNPPKPRPRPAAVPHHPVRFFSKPLSGSDVANERIFVGRPGDRMFGVFRRRKSMLMKDLFGGVYAVARNAHALINDGWNEFIVGKGVEAGDQIFFIQFGRGRERDWLIGLRKEFKPEKVAMPSPEVVMKLVQDLKSNKLGTVRLYMGNPEKIFTMVGSQVP